MYLLKIGFSRISPANLNVSRENFAGIRRSNSNLTHVLKFWRLDRKGAKWRRNATNTMNSHFFVTGQNGMKFGQKMSIGVLYWTSIEEFWKFSL